MEYKGKEISCEAEALRMIEVGDELLIGYYGSGGVFVEFDRFTNELEAEEAFDEIYGTLSYEEDELWEPNEDWEEEAE